MATINQMLVRANLGHINALCNIRDGKEIKWRSAGEYRGWKQVLSTLQKWGALENGKVTEIGNALLEAKGIRPATTETN